MNKEKIALLVDSGTDVPAQIMEQYGMYIFAIANYLQGSDLYR